MLLQKIYPTKLKSGDNVALIAPALSFSIVSESNAEYAKAQLEEMGLRITCSTSILK